MKKLILILSVVFVYCGNVSSKPLTFYYIQVIYNTVNMHLKGEVPIVSSSGYEKNGKYFNRAFNSNGECEDYLVGTVLKTHAALNFEVKLGEDNKRYLYSKSDNIIAKGSCIKIDIDLEIN